MKEDVSDMKTPRQLMLAVTMGILAALVACVAFAQSQQSPKPPRRTRHTATHHVVHRSLLDPASLNQKAPATYKAKFLTTKGDFVVDVTRAWAPLGADRFYNLVKNGYYNNCVLFRVVPGFVVQFGINGSPKISAPWEHANLPDDPVLQSNKLGTITYATAGPNSRTTQVFVNLGDNSRLDGQGFAPFGQVIEGMDVIQKFDSEYDDQPTNMQDQIQSQGNVFLKAHFPNLDSIKTAVIVPVAPSAPSKKPSSHTAHRAGSHP
jgi:peptidyl-prolyl cis-trans isomerase A (cyclophilin A)